MSIKPREKPVKGKCLNRHCSKVVKTGKRLCDCCRKARWRQENPIQYYYQNLKSSALRRHIPFDLSLEDFMEFAFEVDFTFGGNKHANGWSVDRINDDPQKGYHGYRRDNLQKLTLGENSRKRHKKVAFHWDPSQGGAHFKFQEISSGESPEPDYF